MFPLVPTLILAFVSFIASAFVILRIIIPILPPHPLSRRVPPTEFNLPERKRLSPADKSHLWLASLDVVAIAMFVWQALAEYFGGVSGLEVASDPASAIRLWIATTLRQNCLLIVAALTLFHVRMGHSVGFGKLHWMLWTPALLLAGISTALAGVFAMLGIQSYFWGLLGYSTVVAGLSSIAFACLIGTLLIIRRNLAALHDIRDPSPPTQTGSDERHHALDTVDLNALKDGSSWLTSPATSRLDSIPAFSFSTRHTSHSRMQSSTSSRVLTNTAITSNLSTPAKAQTWFDSVPPHSKDGRLSPIRPISPLTTPYDPSTYDVGSGPDQYHNPSPPRKGGQSSWLTEPSTSQTTMSAWSFPPSSPSSPLFPASNLHSECLKTPERVPMMPSTRSSPAIVPTHILGGYGRVEQAVRVDSGTSETALPGTELDVSLYRALGWLVTIWAPMLLALPYYIAVHFQSPTAAPWAAYLLIFSVTISSPLLAINLSLRSPISAPSWLFQAPVNPPSTITRRPSSTSAFFYEYKRSGSATYVEGRRSSDIWLAQGDAVGDKGTVGRALSLLHRQPKLSVLPPESEHKDTPGTPRLPSRQNSTSRPDSSKAKTTNDTDPDDQRSLPPSLRFSLSLQSSGLWRQHFGQDVETQQAPREPIALNSADMSNGDSSYCIVDDTHPDAAEEELEVLHSLPTSPVQSRSFPDSLTGIPDVPKSVAGSKRNSLGTLISALDKELQIPPTASDIDLFDFNPDMEGIAASTPHGTKAQHSHPTEIVPELPRKQSAGASSVETGGVAASSSLGVDRHNTTVQPLVPKPRARKLKLKASKVFDQESTVASDPARSAKRDMRPLSLQEQEANAGTGDDTSSRIVRPLSIKDKGKGREKLAHVDHKSATAESPRELKTS